MRLLSRSPRTPRSLVALGVALLAGTALAPAVASAAAASAPATPPPPVVLTRTVAAGDAMARAGVHLVPVAGARQRTNADRTTTYTFTPAGPAVPGDGGTETLPLRGAWVLYGLRTGRLTVVTGLQWRTLAPARVALSGVVNGGRRIDLLLGDFHAFGTVLFATTDFQQVLDAAAGTSPVLPRMPPTTLADFARYGPATS
jgi:hypothetical protein